MRPLHLTISVAVAALLACSLPGVHAQQNTPPDASQAQPNVTAHPRIDTGAGNTGGTFLFASQIIGMAVISSDDQQIGTIRELVIEPRTGQATPQPGTQSPTQPDENTPPVAPRNQRPGGATPRSGTPPAQSGTTGRATPPAGAAAEGSLNTSADGTEATVGAEARGGIGNFVANANANANSAVGSGLRYALVEFSQLAQGRVAIVPWELLTYTGNAFMIGFSSDLVGQLPTAEQNDPRLLQQGEWDQVDQFFMDQLRQIRAARPDLTNPETPVPEEGTDVPAPGTVVPPGRVRQPGVDPNTTPDNATPRRNRRTDTPATPNPNVNPPAQGRNPRNQAPGAATPGAGATPQRRP